LSRFDEMRRLGQASEQQRKVKRRKSYQKNGKSSSKRRRSSLFSVSHLSKEVTAGSSSPFLASSKHDTHAIGQFSTDDEEDNCPLKQTRDYRNIPAKKICTSFEKQPKELEKRVSSSCSKEGGWNKSRQSCNKATFSSIMKPDDNASLIKWSDSDSEQHSDSKSFPREAATEQDCIGVFESPVKALGMHSPNIVDIDSFPDSLENYKLSSQLEIKEEKPKQKGPKEGSFIPKLTDSSKKRRFKDVKGGMVELYKKVVSRERSDIAFWKHSLNADKDEIAVCPIREDKSKLVLRVEDIAIDFSLTVLKCSKLRDNFSTVYIILPISALVGYKIEKNDLLELYAPFRKVNVKGIPQPVLLCAYFLKVVNSSSEFSIIQDCCESEKADSDSLASQEVYTSANSVSATKCLNDNSQVQQSIATSFSECSLSQVVSFSATVIKSSLTIRRDLSMFHTNSDESIVNCVMKRIKEARPDNCFELFLVLKDEVGHVGLLSLVLKDNRTRELCHLFKANGKRFLFKHFFLTDTLSLSFNQTVLSILRTLKPGDSCVEDMCCVFSESEDSDVSLCKTDENLTSKSSEKPQTSLPSNFCQRVSFYGCCICIVPGIHVENPSSGSNFCMFAVKSGIEYQEHLPHTSLSSMIEKSVPLHIEKLPTCYIPDFVSKCFLERGKIFLFQDLLEIHGAKQFLLDKLSRICLVQCESDTEEVCTDCTTLHGIEIVGKEFLDSLVKDSFMCNISVLSFVSKERTLVFVEGSISGINDDSAVFWTVCGNCGLETKEPVTKATFLCNACGKLVKSNFHVQLEVNLTCEDMPGVQITVKLLEKTIFKYLPLSISEGFNGYDTECIIGKKLGKKLCYIESLVHYFDTDSEKESITSVNLKEVTVAEEMIDYLNL